MSNIIKRKITPKSDIIFKNIFGKEENVKLLESLLESILGEKVDVISTIKSKELDIKNIKDKVGVLDVQAILKDGTIVNIEMQNQEYEEYSKRVLFYVSKLISGQIKKKEKYKEIKDVISINILNYEIPWIKDYVSKYEINSVNEKNEKINGLTIYFIQLPRFEKERKLLEKNIKYEDIVKSKLDEWCVYFSYKNREVLKMVQVKNMDIEEAVKLYGELQERDDVVDLYFSRWLAEMDEEVRIECAEERGMEVKQEEIIKNLLRQKVDLEVIIKATGVTKDKIDEIMELYKAS